MKTLKIKAEYQCCPLWLKENNQILENLDLSQTNFSTQLKDKINKWAKAFDLTLNQDYPPDSKFASIEDEIKFEKEGLLIWKKIIHDYSNDYDKIKYFSTILNKTYNDVDSYEEDVFKKLGKRN